MAEISMNVIEAIYNRRAVRDYLPEKIDKSIIRRLLDAAVQAPTALHEEPCTFVVVQDISLLNRISEITRALSDIPIKFTDKSVFYNANTLIIICSKPLGRFVAADCWLAAENLMLAAVAKGLGSCVIGTSVIALNTPQCKIELGIPAEVTVVAPIIIGLPAMQPPKVTRKAPDILSWK